MAKTLSTMGNSYFIQAGFEWFNNHIKPKFQHRNVRSKQALNGSIIIGDSHEYAETDENAKLPIGIDMEINELILKEAKRMISLPDWKIQNYWAGYYAQSADGSVYEHNISNKIYISTGIGGKGMTTGAGYSRKRIEEIFA